MGLQVERHQRQQLAIPMQGGMVGLPAAVGVSAAGFLQRQQKLVAQKGIISARDPVPGVAIDM